MKATSLAALALTVMISGCTTFAVPKYSADAETVAALRRISDIKVQIGTFTTTTGDKSEQGELSCRLIGPITTPDAESYAEYIRKAIISEMIIANMYDEQAKIILTGQLDELNFDSMSGKWMLTLTLHSNNGKSLTVHTNYTFKSSFMAEFACNQTALAGLGAVQKLIKDVVYHPDFKAMLQ